MTRDERPPFEKPQGKQDMEDEKPPFGKPQGPPVFSRWAGWYWLVFLVMAAQVLFYLYITRSFS